MVRENFSRTISPPFLLSTMIAAAPTAAFTVRAAAPSKGRKV